MAFLEPVEAHRGQLHVDQRLEDGFGVRSLESDETDVVALVHELDIELAGQFTDVCPVLVDVRSVDHEPETLLSHPVDQQVIDDSAIRQAEHAVLYLSEGQLRWIIRGHIRHERQSSGPFDHELAHVGHIEHAG